MINQHFFARNKVNYGTSFLILFVLLSYFAQGQSIDTISPETKEMDILRILINFLAGLVLFLFGITQLSNGIKAVAKEKVKNIITKFTASRFAGLLSGFTASAILDSSSVAIIMVIAFVNAGALTSLQALGVVLGANIGTTVSSQIVAFNLYQYSPIAMFIGFLIFSLSRSKKIKKIGHIVFGIGLIFLGMKEMGEAMSPLKDSETFIIWMKDVENPLLGIVVGAAFTVLIQSSSATLGVVITLATQGMISLPAGIAIMMGAEIGTCADTLVATIGRTREAIKVGVFHLFFNIISVLLGLFFFNSFVELVNITSSKISLSHQIANAHLLFNLLGALLFIGFTPWIGSVLDKIIQKKEFDEFVGEEVEVENKSSK